MVVAVETSLQKLLMRTKQYQDALYGLPFAQSPCTERGRPHNASSSSRDLGRSHEYEQPVERDDLAIRPA